MLLQSTEKDKEREKVSTTFFLSDYAFHPSFFQNFEEIISTWIWMKEISEAVNALRRLVEGTYRIIYNSVKHK